MYLMFVAAFVSAASLVFLPGLLAFWGWGVAAPRAFALAPAFSVVVCELLCVFFAVLGIDATYWSVGGPVLVLGGVLCAVGFALGRRRPPRSGWLSEVVHQPFRKLICNDGLCLLTYLIFATGVVVWVFVATLDGAASFPQDTDNSAHLGWVKTFVESRNMSTLDVTFYSDDLSRDAPIVDAESGYYPAAWHMLCALVAQSVDAPIPLAVNAVNTVLLALVLPSGTFLFLRSLFGKSWGIVYSGALVCLAFPSFPWGLVLPPSGPLYPNFASMCVLPSACALFVWGVKNWADRRGAARAMLYFLVAMIAVALLHPGGVFTGYAVLAPFFVLFAARRAYCWRCAKGGNGRSAALWAFAAVVVLGFVAVGLWLVLYGMPALQGVVSYNWPPSMDVSTALLHACVLSFARPNVMVVLPFVVLVGMLVAVRRIRYIWLVVVFAFFVAGFVVAASSDGLWDRLLTGFWYTDPVRVAANAGFIGVPIAALGLWAIVSMVFKITRHCSPARAKRVLPAIVSCLLVVAFLSLNFTRSVAGRVWTSFDDVFGCLEMANKADRPNTFSPEERDFVAKVKEMIGDNTLILNVADDGSCYAYVTDGLKLVYRRTSVGGEIKDEPDAAYLRQHLSEVATSEEVKRILRENGIEYVLLLDQGGEVLPERCYYGFYVPDYWKGFNDITDDTPGFEAVLSEGDMRLYRILDE